MPLAFATLNRGVIPFGFFNVKSDMLLMAEYFVFADAFCGWVEELVLAAAGSGDDGPAAAGPAGPDDLDHAAGGFAEEGRDVRGPIRLRRPVWIISDRVRLGAFHGAMAGTELWGFFGAVYRRFPFPAGREDFHQEPEGWRAQDEMRALANEWARPGELVVAADRATSTVELGGYRFDPPGFAALLLYLWQGGAPRWMGGVRPPYVERMMRTVREVDSWLSPGFDHPV